MVELWAIIKTNCECNCRYDLYKCIEWSYILQSLCICNNLKKNLHMNVAKVDFYFIEFLAMIVKKFNEKNIFHLTWNLTTCKKIFINQIFTTMVIDVMILEFLTVELYYFRHFVHGFAKAKVYYFIKRVRQNCKLEFAFFQ